MCFFTCVYPLKHMHFAHVHYHVFNFGSFVEGNVMLLLYSKCITR